MSLLRKLVSYRAIVNGEVQYNRVRRYRLWWIHSVSSSRYGCLLV